MKKNVMVSVTIEPWAELKARGENISELCDQAFHAAASIKPETDQQSAKELKQELTIQTAKLATIKAELAKREKADKPASLKEQQQAARELHARRLMKKKEGVFYED